MDVQVEDLSTVAKKLSFTVDSKTVDQKLKSAYDALQKEVKLPGFRKGKVPREVLEQRFGADVSSKAAEELARELAAKELVERKITPLSEPVLEGGPVTQGKPFKFSVTVELRPEITLGATADLKVTIESAEMSDDELETHLQTIRQQARSLVPVAEERALQTGDVAVVTAVMKAEGYDDHRREGVHLGLPDDASSDFLNELARGLKRGESRTGTVTVPEDYFDPTWAGATCEATIELNEIEKIELPPLDDSFAAKLGHESLEAARQDLRRQLISVKQQRARAHAERSVVAQLIDQHSFEVPPQLLRQRAEVLARAIGAELLGGASSGETTRLDDLADDKRADVLQEAEFSVRRELLLDAIAQRDGLEVTDEDRKSRIADIARRTGQPAATVRSYLVDSGGLQSLDARILEEKAVVALVEKATRD
jgi:trigger factor